MCSIPCRRSSVRDVHVHATAPVVNGDRDLGRIVGLDHRHLEHLHATSLSHPCSTFDKHCLSVLRAFTCSLSVRTHTVRWTSAARRARSPPQCGATYPLRFPAIEVVLACFQSPCRTSPRVPRQPGLRSLSHCRRQLRTPVCSWSSSILPRAPRRPGPRARRPPPCCRRRRARRSPPCCRCCRRRRCRRRCNRPRDLAAMGGLSMKRAPGADTPEMKRCHGGHNECAFRVME
jgi:hypothetical protein